jgi:membrane peptidoglycan carboxypeptidase
MDNDWNQQPSNNEGQQPPRRLGLLSGYQQQQQQSASIIEGRYELEGQQTAPQPSIPARSPGLLSDHRLRQEEPVTPPQTPVPQLDAGQFHMSPRLEGLVLSTQNWITNKMQAVRRWSEKMGAIYGGYTPPEQPPAPLELYRQPLPITAPVAPQKPWKRSHTVRVVMQRRHRRERVEGTAAQKSWRILVMALLLLVVIGSSSGGAYAYAYYQQQYPQVQNLANQQVSQTTRIYDRNMQLLYEAYDPAQGGRRTPVSYNQIPKVMQDAMVDTEDRTFWTNSGIDPQGMLRNLPGLLSGHATGGGSTLTQQLVKNLRNDSTYSIDRKLSEAALAIALTEQYPKWKILEMYFNVSPFGAQDLGVEAAVEDYFHLMPQCSQNFNCTPGIARLNYNQDTGQNDPLLGLARASLLAGLPQSPYEFDPTLGNAFKQRALDRQKIVLDSMIAAGASVDGLGPVTPAIAQQAENLTAQMTFSHYDHVKKAPGFVDWIIDQMETALGNGDPNRGISAFLTSGFNIRTTIDANLESYVEAAVTRHLTEPEFQPFLNDYGPLNTVHNVNDAAVVVMDSHNGEILAMDGSSDYNSNDPRIDGNYNVATMPVGRPPGSSFKPIVYATTFAMGWTPGTVLPDYMTVFPQNTYVPNDYGNQYSNTMSTIRVATADSRNVPAVKAMEFAGVNNVANVAQAMGITSLNYNLNFFNKEHNSNSDINAAFGLPMALGTIGVPVLQMTGAYQVFANGGVRIPPQGILDVWDNYGHHLFQYAPPQGTRVLSPQVAYMMTSVLSDEPARQAEFANDHILSFTDQDPTCATQRICNLQVAAKTGTTDSFKDNWTIGYTPDVVVGVWAGNADNEVMNNTIGLTGAAPIWHSVIERASGFCTVDEDDIPCGNYNAVVTQRQFTIPSGIHQACLSAANGLLGNSTSNCDWVIDGQDPQQPGNPNSDTNIGTATNPNNGLVGQGGQ